MESVTQLTKPNRVRDLSEYWQRLHEQDVTVPALKPWLAGETETLWKKVLEMTKNQPTEVQLNSYLSVYAGAGFQSRAMYVFKSFEVGDDDNDDDDCKD